MTAWLPIEKAPRDGTPSRDWLEFRPDHNGDFDEFIARFDGGMVHVETTGAKSVYIGFYQTDIGETLQLWINSGGKLSYQHERSVDPTPRDHGAALEEV